LGVNDVINTGIRMESGFNVFENDDRPIGNSSTLQGKDRYV